VAEQTTYPRCRVCAGEGEVEEPIDMDLGGHLIFGEITCSRCGGSGIDPQTDAEFEADIEKEYQRQLESHRRYRE
jgi:DnaJ-class molecular chaperone